MLRMHSSHRYPSEPGCLGKGAAPPAKRQSAAATLANGAPSALLRAFFETLLTLLEVLALLYGDRPSYPETAACHFAPGGFAVRGLA